MRKIKNDNENFARAVYYLVLAGYSMREIEALFNRIINFSQISKYYRRGKALEDIESQIFAEINNKRGQKTGKSRH